MKLRAKINPLPEDRREFIRVAEVAKTHAPQGARLELRENVEVASIGIEVLPQD